MSIFAPVSHFNMELVLPFQIPPSAEKISLKHSILFTGSCFAEEMGQRMQQRYFDICLNPFGILYNSESIAASVLRMVEGRHYTSSELTECNGVWFSYSHHSRFNADTATACLEKINRSLDAGRAVLEKASWLCITLGSSWSYWLQETEKPVGNCHKMPAKLFTKRLLPAAQQIQQWEECIAILKQFNPLLKIVFSISPVRYIRDGLTGNNLSKAQLFTTVHHLVSEHPDIQYFPAYELVTDVLRDYRFFKEDMVHPSEQAIQYVWERFTTCYFDAREQEAHTLIEDLIKMTGHRVLNANAEAMHEEQLRVKNEKVALALQKLKAPAGKQS